MKINNTIEQPTATEGYHSNQDYWRDRLALLSLLLHREVKIMRTLRGDGRQEGFLGLFISDEDISAIMNELHGQQQASENDQYLDKRIQTLATAIEKRASNTHVPLPLHQLADTFSLGPCEQLMLVMAIAVEIDSRFTKVYGYLHDDVARKRVSPGLVKQILGEKSVAALDIRSALHSDSPLIKFQLITLLDDDQTPLFQRGLGLDTRVTNHLLGFNSIDNELLGLMDHPWLTGTPLQQDPCTESSVMTAKAWREQPRPMVIEAAKESDMDVWMALLTGHLNLPLLSISWQRISPLDSPSADKLLGKLAREALLTGSILLIRDLDANNPQLLSILTRHLISQMCLASAERIVPPNFQGPILRLALPPLAEANRRQLWQSSLSQFNADLPFDSAFIADLAQRYSLNATNIATICAHHQSASEQLTNQSTILRACQHHVGHQMRDVAQRFESTFGLQDIVLSPVTQQALEELIARQSSGYRVFKEWGLGATFRQSEGCTALFIGPSGTGKTMAASVIANELGYDMYRVDLSGVVSKYIGETEKNLSRIFSAAAESQVVLFIDEADALFGKRSEVKDAHDRYANIEVSYLLQKMEEHPGFVVLASNFCQNIDDAFFRRFSTVVEFTAPQAQERLKLWQKLHNSQAPLAADLDLNFLAQRFELTGGHIKNCIMAAAFHAASQESVISMPLLIRAVSREYTKLGKPISKQSFGDYYASLRKESVSG